MPEIPRQIGRYQIEATLGGGAMGIVYRAHDPVIERAVAIKLVRADLLDGDDQEGFLTRFRNEAKLAGRCAHPNIVGVYDYAMHEETPYLVMEYVDGSDLGRIFKRGTRASVSDACGIAVGVLDALTYAHGFRIVHRDIKPANILVTTNGGLKVTDFGISRLAVPDTKQSAVLLGTPGYMAPEQCRGEAVDGRCDLFSLGCVLFELLAGERAFVGANYVETIHKIVNQPHPSLLRLRPDLSSALVDIIDRALAKRADARFASAAEMAASVRALSVATPPRIDDLATVVRPAREAGSVRNGLGIEDSSMTMIERRLAHYIGPMAGYYLRCASKSARSVDELCELLGRTLPEEETRTQFVRDMLALLNSSGNLQAAHAHDHPSTLECNATTIARLTRALAEVMGPIAPRLIARAQSRATNMEQMEELCAGMIPHSDARDRFRHLLVQRSDQSILGGKAPRRES
jgi:eukaryotic-like serine/threonine-protein kinase